MHQTLDVEEDKMSNISAGGTRYIVGFKGGLKFYGDNADNQSISQHSQNRPEDVQSAAAEIQGKHHERSHTADQQSRALNQGRKGGRTELDARSNNSIEKTVSKQKRVGDQLEEISNEELAQAYDNNSQSNYPDNVS